MIRYEIRNWSLWCTNQIEDIVLFCDTKESVVDYLTSEIKQNYIDMELKEKAFTIWKIVEAMSINKQKQYKDGYAIIDSAYIQINYRSGQFMGYIGRQTYKNNNPIKLVNELMEILEDLD